MDVGSPVADFWLNVINEGGFATGAIFLFSICSKCYVGKSRMCVRVGA